MAISPYIVPVDAHGRESRAHGKPQFPVACYHDDLTVDTVPWHWHEELEAAIVTEGRVVVATDQEEMVLHTGEGVLYQQ